MAVLSDSTVLVDVVVTAEGRKRLLADRDFKITKFSLEDTEIDYGLWNPSHPSGSDSYGNVIENIPVFEPNSNNQFVYQTLEYPFINEYTGKIDYEYEIVYTNFLGSELVTLHNAEYSDITSYNNLKQLNTKLSVDEFKMYVNEVNALKSLNETDASVNNVIYNPILDQNYSYNNSLYNYTKRIYSSYIPSYQEYGRSFIEFRNYFYKSASILDIPKSVFGEKITPGTFELIDSSNSGLTITIRDDKKGNIYDVISSSVVSNGLIDWFPFTDTVMYETGSFHGVISSDSCILTMNFYTASFNAGVVFNALSFNGSSSYAKISHNNLITPISTQDFAVSLWVNITGSQIGGFSDYTIIDNGDSNTSAPYRIKIDSNFKPLIQRHSLGTVVANFTGSTSVTSSFHHIVVQKSNTTMSLYVNGAIENSASIDLSTVYNDRDIYIASGSNGSMLRGSIDQLRFYNRALTDNEITNLYNMPFNTNVVGNVFYKEGLVVLTHMSGAYKELLTDQSGNGYDISFRSTVTLHEYEIFAIKPTHELNFTNNKTVLNENETGIRNEITASYFSPYATGINFFDDEGVRLVTAKFKNPIKVNQSFPLSFTCRFDKHR